MERPIEEIQAGDEFRASMIEKADIVDHGYQAWRGWVIMDAFLAGIDWARAHDAGKHAQEERRMAYSPCRNGIHVCGINGDETEFVTVFNAPGVAEAKFKMLEDEYGIDGDPDLVVDLMLDGDIVRDFGIRRQSLAAVVAACGSE